MIEQSLVRAERSYYTTVLKDCANNLRKTFTLGEVLQVPPPNSRIPAMSNRTTFHYSFNMAQVMFCKCNPLLLETVHIFQVHYPSNPFQPGEIYILTPRKYAIFGVCCKAIPHQVSNISSLVHTHVKHWIKINIKTLIFKYILSCWHFITPLSWSCALVHYAVPKVHALSSCVKKTVPWTFCFLPKLKKILLSYMFT